MDRDAYEMRVRAVNFRRTDPRDLFTSQGRRVYYSDLERALHNARHPSFADLARLALARDPQAIDQFDASLREGQEFTAGIGLSFLGLAGLVVGGRALASRFGRQGRREAQEARDFPRARVLR